MSAYSVGTTAFVGAHAAKIARNASAKTGATPEVVDATEQAAAPTEKDGLSVIIKWVPGEVIGAYAAVVAAVQPGGKGAKLIGSSSVMLLGFCAGAFLFTYLGGVLAYRKIDPAGRMAVGKFVELAVRGILSGAGLLLWSYIVPGSATSQSYFGLRHSAELPVLIPFLAILFGLFAEWAVLPVTLKLIAAKWRG